MTKKSWIALGIFCAAAMTALVPLSAQAARRMPVALNAADADFVALREASLRGDMGEAGRIDIIDLDLSRYNQLASRFAAEREDTQSRLKSGIATRNANFNRMIAEIEQVAQRLIHLQGRKPERSVGFWTCQVQWPVSLGWPMGRMPEDIFHYRSR